LSILFTFCFLDPPTTDIYTLSLHDALPILDNTKVLCVSRDLPFALKRFCGAEGLDQVISLSDYKDGSFGKAYGLNFVNGPLEALHSRCVVVLDENGTVKYTEQVPEIADEPNYKAALEALMDD